MLGSVIKSKASVVRVVLTSSIAAMRSTATPAVPVNPPLYSEHDWNEVSRDAVHWQGATLADSRACVYVWRKLCP